MFMTRTNHHVTSYSGRLIIHVVGAARMVVWGATTTNEVSRQRSLGQL